MEVFAYGIICLYLCTLTHCNMATTSIADKRHELAASKHELEALIQRPVISFAYPFGIYSAEDIQLGNQEKLVQEPSEDKALGDFISSPMVGTFYGSASPGSDPCHPDPRVGPKACRPVKR